MGQRVDQRPARHIDEIAILRQDKRTSLTRGLEDHGVFRWNEPEISRVDRLDSEALGQPSA